MSTKQIEEWKKRITEIDALIEPLTTEQAELRQKIADAKSPFKPGDIIEWGRGKGNRRGRVVKARQSYYDYSSDSWSVIRLLKNGSDGMPCTVYDFEKPKKI